MVSLTPCISGSIAVVVECLEAPFEPERLPVKASRCWTLVRSPNAVISGISICVLAYDLSPGNTPPDGRRPVREKIGNVHAVARWREPLLRVDEKLKLRSQFGLTANI
jgi:hypothetical protein